MIHVLSRYTVRVALSCAALLGLAAIPLAGSASATTPACTITTNPLGAATGFTEFMFGNGQRHGVESEGSVAYGGTLTTGGTMPVGGHLMAEAVPPPTASTPTLVIGGALNGNVNLAAGSAYVPGSTGVNFNGGGGYLASNPINFAAALTDLQAKSNAWAAATPNGDVQTTVQDGFKGRITFHGTDPQLNVFTIDASQLHPSGAISELRFFYDVPAGAVSIINVTGTSASIKAFEVRVGTPASSNQASDGTKAQMKGVLWNFPDATSINIDLGAAWGGSILAPKASITSNASPMIGQFIAKDFDLNRETHINQFPSTACVPGGGGGGGDNADVQITKSASKANPSGGSTFIYSLTVKNNGPDKAKNVVAHDTLPLGVTFDWASTGCSVAGTVVTCDAGDLSSGDSKTFKIGVIANPIGSGGSLPHPGQQHNLTVEKVEAQVDLNPGETKTVALSCPNGGILSDGSVRVDAVDQGTGALTDVHVISAQSTGVSTWEAVVSNGATGRAQAKGFAVCLPAKTESAGGHQHSLVVNNTLATTSTPLAVGRQTVTLACPSGTMPIVPGYALAGGAATLAGSEPISGGWKFTFDVTSATTVTVSARCLDTDVAAAQGHTHALVTQHLVKNITIGAGQTVEEQVICADDAKGIVGTWSLPPGVYSLGNDPRPKTRAFKLVNTTGSDQTAMVDLECLKDRTGPEKLVGASPVSVKNTATVTTTSTDSNPANNSSDVTVTVQPGNVVALGASAKAGSSKITVTAISSVSDSATITIKSKTGDVWASGTTSLTAGVAKSVQLNLTSAGQSALGSSTKKGKGLIEISAGSATRWMTIKPA